VTKDSDAFFRQFGFAPDLAVSSWPGFANTGDEVVLVDTSHRIVDVLVYGKGNNVHPGWSGVAVQPYTVRGLFSGEGQILFRKREQSTGFPVPDTNSAEDWAQAGDDPLNGRSVLYPGWDADEFFFTMQVTQMAALTVAIAPDNALETVVNLINKAEQRVDIESLTIENISIGNALVSAAERGVLVKLLLEGSPPGGLSVQEKFICQQIEKAGGECWFMIRKDDQRIHDRYRYLHAKFILIDGRQVAISSENLSPNSMPDDDKSDGTWGRRGVLIITNAGGVIDHVRRVFDEDLDSTNHVDIFRWQPENPIYGAPPPDFIPVLQSGGVSYTVRFPLPAVFHGTFAFEVQQAPENSLREGAGLLNLVSSAGEGDTILIQQLQERPHWGNSDSDAVADPNPRLEAYIAAARRGANVRLLLDSFFDRAASNVSNAVTCHHIKEIADKEKLKLSCALGNPTGLGIHNKMVLANVNGQGYAYVGSINGSELSNKGNREIALLVQSSEVYVLLAEMFEYDSAHWLQLPVIMNDFRGPARHLLISEVLYDPYGTDETEFIEVVNPTSELFDLSEYSLSDAVGQEDYEDLRRFPPSSLIGPSEVVVVATSADAYRNEYGVWPDFEILETVQIVPNLVDDPSWGDPSTFLRLGNSGDEVILRDRNGETVDALAYGIGDVSGNVACPLLSGTNHSLERFPYWRDSDRCPDDFRDWPFPSPGRLP
jgi:phosphatidylserine/phosphatidylglycerophosphate/cardiolipin synthase-like enzyme